MDNQELTPFLIAAGTPLRSKNYLEELERTYRIVLLGAEAGSTDAGNSGAVFGAAEAEWIVTCACHSLLETTSSIFLDNGSQVSTLYTFLKKAQDNTRSADPRMKELTNLRKTLDSLRIELRPVREVLRERDIPEKFLKTKNPMPQLRQLITIVEKVVQISVVTGEIFGVHVPVRELGAVPTDIFLKKETAHIE